MNVFGGFILGLGVGSIITYFLIILLAKTMDKENKELYTKTVREKWK